MAEQKTIEQILFLSKNKYYKLSASEEARLNDFLSEKKASASKKSRTKSSRKSSDGTPVRVKNVVKKTKTDPPVVENEEWKEDVVS